MDYKYFIIVDDKQSGPFTIDELKNAGLNKRTLIWRDGLLDWIEADSIEELKYLFVNTPPPIPKSIKAAEIIIKTEKPLQIEDKIKRENINNKKIKFDQFKRMFAYEIRRAFKFIIISLILGAITFIIYFSFNGGFVFLPYYYECERESSAISNITNIQSKDSFQVINYYDFEKWSKITGLQYDISSKYDDILNNLSKPEPQWLNNVEIVYNILYFTDGVNYPDKWQFQQRDYDLKINAVGKYEEEYYKSNIKNKKDQSIEGELKDGIFYLKHNESSSIEKNEKLSIKHITSITIELFYGRVIKRNVENAFSESLDYSLIALISIFPGLYLLILLINWLRGVKLWIDQNSKK